MQLKGTKVITVPWKIPPALQGIPGVVGGYLVSTDKTNFCQLTQNNLKKASKKKKNPKTKKQKINPKLGLSSSFVRLGYFVLGAKFSVLLVK